MDIPTERQLYDSASAYYRGADILMKQSSAAATSRHLAQPAVTCTALSLKLYLKCLLTLEGKDKEAKTMYEFAVKNNPDNQFAMGGLEKVNKILNLSEENNNLL